jgi:D-alanine-D-alanine ligase
MKKVALVYTAVPESAPLDEQDTLIQANFIRPAISKLGFEVIDIPVANLKDVEKQFREVVKPDLVFNLAESINGSGKLIHLVPNMLDTLGIPYTGSSAKAIFLTSNKILAKKILIANNIPTPPFLNGSFDPPYIVKSTWEHASIGMTDSSVVYTEEALNTELQKRKNEELFVEKFIDGREMSTTMLSQNKDILFLPPREVVFKEFPDGKPHIVGYDAKWLTESFEYVNTSLKFRFRNAETELIENLIDISKKCWDIFGLSGYVRIDFRIDKDNRPYVLELNANPCLAPDAGYMIAAKRIGLTIKDVVRSIIEAVA